MKAIIHKINTKQEGAAALFMDAEKAFDSVDWINFKFLLKYIKINNL